MIKSILDSLRTLFFQPLKFFKGKDYKWIWFVSGGTFIMANLIDSICENYSLNLSF